MHSLVAVVDYVIDWLYNKACCLSLVVDVDVDASKFHFLLTVPRAYVVGLISHSVIWSYFFPRLQSRLQYQISLLSNNCLHSVQRNSITLKHWICCNGHDPKIFSLSFIWGTVQYFFLHIFIRLKDHNWGAAWQLYAARSTRLLRRWGRRTSVQSMARPSTCWIWGLLIHSSPHDHPSASGDISTQSFIRLSPHYSWSSRA